MTEAVKAIKRKSKIRASGKDKAFLFFVYLFLTLSLLVVLLPLIYVVSASFSDSKAVVSGEVWLLPVRPTLKGYTAVFENPQIMTGFLNSFIYMFAGTAVSLVLTVLAAYPLSRGELAGKKLFNGLFLFTMLFSGGMIPSYILLRDLNMLNTRWAIIIPTALSVWNLIITRTYYQNTIPGDIYEAAYLDGCSDLRILFSIVIPLSGPILAVMGLYYAIGQWNSYFNAMIYLKDQELFPLQIILRNILIQNQMSGQMITDVKQLERMQGMAQLLKYSVMVVSCLPLVALYPFVQKFFVKGVMFGAVKG